MFFNSVKEINRLRKEINRLLSKRMSNIYLKVTIDEKIGRSQNLDFLRLKKNCHLNFKTSCCNLKIRRMGAKLCVTFLLF